MSLHIARGLDLPDDFVTQTCAILARRGAGKTYTAKVIAEELLERALPVVVLDPVGVWHGLRSNAAGTGAGYPVTILGGEHGDLPLDANAGVLVANLVASDPVAVVLDLSGFNSKGEHRRFVTDFAERLYRAKAQSSERTALHLIIDEADEFAPQRTPSGDQRMLGAFETLVRRGRARGIGVTMITQRPAVLNKNVLTQVECLIVMQITSPQDRKAIGEWVEGNADKAEQQVVEASLAGLDRGEGWFWSPAWLQTLQRIKVRKARTFDSSATPRAGEARREATVLAPVDLDRLKEGMERVVADAERNDPRLLQARIRDLEREAAARPTVEPETIFERVEVPVVPDWIAPDLTLLLADVDAMVQSATEVRDTVAAFLERAEEQVTSDVDPVATVTRPAPAPETPRRAAPTPILARRPLATGDSHATLGKAERAVLTVLAQYPDGRTRAQVAFLTGYSPTTSTLSVVFGKLRKLGYMTPSAPLQITDAGVAALGTWEPLPTGRALLDYWMGKLGKAEQLILRYMLDVYPATTTRDEVAAATGYSAQTSTLSVALGKLRRVELVDGWKVDDDFVDAIR